MSGCAKTTADNDHGDTPSPGGGGGRAVGRRVHGACTQAEVSVPRPAFLCLGIYLGICLGFQVAVIEFARNVLGISGAHSTEFEPDCAGAVIAELPEQKALEGIMGGTMRLGAQDVVLEQGSLASKLYGDATSIRERFRHRYEVEPGYIDRLGEAGLHFSGRHPKYPIMQVLELPPETHPYFVGAQFHPELTSRPLAPNPLFMGLVAAAIRSANGGENVPDLPPRWLPSSTSEGAQWAPAV